MLKNWFRHGFAGINKPYNWCFGVTIARPVAVGLKNILVASISSATSRFHFPPFIFTAADVVEIQQEKRGARRKSARLPTGKTNFPGRWQTCSTPLTRRLEITEFQSWLSLHVQESGPAPSQTKIPACRRQPPNRLGIYCQSGRGLAPVRSAPTRVCPVDNRPARE